MRPVHAFLLSLSVAICSGCAAYQAHKRGMELVERGRPEEGLSELSQAASAEPDNAKYKLDLAVQRELQIRRWLEEALVQREAGRLDSAELLYERVLTVEPKNDRAASSLRAIAQEREAMTRLVEIPKLVADGDLERAEDLIEQFGHHASDTPQWRQMRRQVREAQIQRTQILPKLKFDGMPAVSLHFVDASLRMIFDALSKSSGITFLFDNDVRSEMRATIDLNQVSVADAIELLLQTNQLQKNVLNDSTLFIYSRAPEKVKQYRELVVRGFYLNNANAKQTEALLRSLLKVEGLNVDERLNLIVMRDTPEAIRLAEKVIAMQDVAEPEVMLEVAVMEVQRSRLTELGIDWPDSVSVTALSATGGPASTLSQFRAVTSDRIGVVTGSAQINLRRELADANILANPRIRVRNKEKASILIGEKVPVLTTTATSTGFVSENVQYLDVGLKLNVEPGISLDSDVAIKVGLEVSSISREIVTANGALVYQIGTRNADTILRLKDGETQVLAGLINNEDRANASRIPGLGDLPILNRLFGSQQRSRNKTEIVLSITPRVVRNIERPDPEAAQFWAGTEADLRTRPLTISAQPLSSGDGASRGERRALTRGASAPNPRLTEAPLGKISLAWEGPQVAKLNEEVKVSLHVDSEGGLRAMPLQIAADTEAFEIIKVEEGPHFPQTDKDSSFAANVDQSTGVIVVGASRNGTSGVKGEGEVLTITLKVKAKKPQAKITVVSVSPIGSDGLGVKVDLPAPLLIKTE